MPSVLFTPLGSEDLLGRNRAIVEAKQTLEARGEVHDLTPVTPMAVERLVTAQMNHYANNGENVRARTLFQATPIGLGWALSLVARIIRIVVRTLGMPISLAVAAFQQSRYAQMRDGEETILKYNIVTEDLRRIGQEWADLGFTLLAGAIGTVNTFAPSAISTEFMYTYYSARNRQNIERNTQFEAARGAYQQQREAQHEAWLQAQQSSEN